MGPHARISSPFLSLNLQMIAFLVVEVFRTSVVRHSVGTFCFGQEGILLSFMQFDNRATPQLTCYTGLIGSGELLSITITNITNIRAGLLPIYSTL